MGERDVGHVCGLQRPADITNTEIPSLEVVDGAKERWGDWFEESHKKACKSGKDFEELVTMDKRFELIVPRYFCVVCFRVCPYVIGKKYENDIEANEFNEKLLKSVNATGCVCMTHSVVCDDGLGAGEVSSNFHGKHQRLSFKLKVGYPVKNYMHD
ncbi:tyrosine/DOPA decarboxylase 5 [Artemisia annua]|uniref:Tyrosine/DOPA decarboxylase 5 n=1 Tax=Artemisia annua TaxID=35608 RepID=A0A2U1NVZ8_ARTAN|nr:tyrosine/DOPA decarboxylase 5 [Artemisia annua]